MFAFVPGVLDFENKRVFFRREIDKIKRESHSDTLNLHIKRSDIFTEAFAQLGHKTARELRGNLNVNFTGEVG
jgi:hypothetical protein